jgi:predicted glycosyl hydrolase (DUF1957 family)
MKKDIILLEEFRSFLDKRLEELEKEQKKYQDEDNYTLYSNIQNRILEVQSIYTNLQALIIKNI